MALVISIENTSQRGEATLRERKESDTWLGKVQYRISSDELRRFSTINQWRSVFSIAWEWLAIASAIWVCSHYWSPILYVATIIWVGARQHALSILMHDAAHYRVFRRKKINDVISELLLAWPLFITLPAYRASHFAHHNYINTDNDPDWVRKKTKEWEFPKGWKELGALLLRDITGFNTLELFSEASDLSPIGSRDTRPKRSYTLARVSYYVVGFTLLAYFNSLVGFLLYWIVPIATWLKLILRIRSIAEHFGIDEPAYALSRTTLLSWFEALFVAPRNVNYHLEHHLYPSVPFYRLPQLHKSLMSIPGYRKQAHVTRTYWGVLKECVGCLSRSR